MIVGPALNRVASVRFGYGSRMERFKQFRFSVSAVPLGKGFSAHVSKVQGMAQFQFRFRFLKNGSNGSSSAFGSWKNGSDGSGFRFQFGSMCHPVLSFTVTDTLKSMEKKGKTLLKKGNPPQEEKTRKSRRTRKGRTGL